MEKFDLHILGCGSALPTTKHLPTSQVLNIREKLYMIDCGEGTQLQLRKSRLSFSRLGHIFISHLHGFHTFDTRVSELIFENRSLKVTTIPLRHRMPCSGFLFEEKSGLPHIRRDMMDYLKIPVCEFNNIKLGADWILPDGTVVPNDRLVFPAEPARRYAYCSDTAFLPENAALVRGVDLLFHEATFAETEARRAAETFHSTAAQAARFASLAEVRRLVIGHFSSRYEDEKQLLEESRSIFENTVLAREGAWFRVRE